MSVNSGSSPASSDFSLENSLGAGASLAAPVSDEYQDRLAIVKDGADIGFWFCDLPFDELIWDHRVKEHFWLSPDARVTIDTFYERLHEDDRERTRATIAESIANKTRYNIDYRTVSPEGSVKWIRAIGRTFYDQDGEPIRFDGVTLDVTERRRTAAALAADKRVLEQIATGRPLEEVLTTLALESEAQSVDGLICSILLIDETGTRLRHGAGPSLPDAYNEAIDGIEIGEGVGSCGTAAATRQAVFVADIERDVLWTDFRDLAAAHGLRSCCSVPFFSSQGELLGTVAMYFRKPHSPNSLDREVIERAVNMAAIVIERHRSIEALKISEARTRHASSELQTTYDQSPIGLGQFDTELRFVRINEQLAAMNGMPAAEHIGKSIYDVVPDLAPKVETMFRQIIETGVPMVDMKVVGETSADPGVEHTWLESWFPMRDPDGAVIGINVVAQDITERLVAETAIRNRELLESAVRFQEAERKRIARDLHDQLGQQLTALRLTLADLSSSVGSLPDLRAKVERAQVNAAALDRDVSSLAFELRANILSEQGLADALDKFVAEWSANYNVRGEFQLRGHAGDASLPDEIENHLYRIAQEALNNTIKHAGAEWVGVMLDIGDADLRMVVADDGIGFDPETYRDEPRRDGHGLGLAGMIERVQLLHGTLTVDSSPGEGTSIIVTVPRMQLAASSGAN